MRKIIDYRLPRTGEVTYRINGGAHVKWHYGPREFITPQMMRKTFQGHPRFEILGNRGRSIIPSQKELGR